VHLTGKADAGDVFAAEIRFGERLADGEAGGAPPIIGMLFGPADLRRGEGLMIRSGGRYNAAVAIDYDGACSAGADVNPKQVDRASRENPG
jgi:hypothetical protein